MPARMYNDKNATQWRLLTRNYWVGRTPHMKTFLDWIDRQPDDEITYDILKQVKDSCELMVDIDILDASMQMWAYLNMNLQGDALEIFNNVEVLNGAEAWRRIIKPIENAGPAKQKALRIRAWNPKPATTAS